MEDDFLGLNVLGDDDEFGVSALDSLRDLVRSFLDTSRVACDFYGF